MNTMLELQRTRYEFNGPLILLTFFGAFLFILAIGVNAHGILTTWNEPLMLSLRQLRSESLDSAMVLFTLLAERPVILCLFAALALYLAWGRYWGALGLWTLNLVFVCGTAFILRMLVHSPRPDVITHIRSANSFPSGHMTLTIGILGLLVLFIREAASPAARRWIFQGFVVFALLMAGTRLTLCAHWLTDILGSLSLGIMSLSLISLTYRQVPCKLPPLKPVLTLGFTGWLLAWSWFSWTHYGTQLANYALLPLK